MRFNQSRYSVNESDGKVDVTLYHSNPSSIDITLKVNSRSISTDGKELAVASYIAIYWLDGDKLFYVYR